MCTGVKAGNRVEICRQIVTLHPDVHNCAKPISNLLLLIGKYSQEV